MFSLMVARRDKKNEKKRGEWDNESEEEEREWAIGRNPGKRRRGKERERVERERGRLRGIRVFLFFIIYLGYLVLGQGFCRIGLIIRFGSVLFGFSISRTEIEPKTEFFLFLTPKPNHPPKKPNHISYSVRFFGSVRFYIDSLSPLSSPNHPKVYEEWSARRDELTPYVGGKVRHA